MRTREGGAGGEESTGKGGRIPGHGVTGPLQVEALVFDLDGTLVDSAEDIAFAVNRMRADFGLGPLPLSRVRAMVGRGARKLVEQAAIADGLPAEAIDVALGRFLAYYAPVVSRFTRAYPGIEEMLARLAPHFSVAVLTNKPEGLSRRILADLELDRWLRLLVGGDTLPVRKPDPQVLRFVAAEIGAVPEHTLVVGDSAVDAATAAAAGAPFALAEWGFGSPEELASIHPELRLSHPLDLVRALLR